MNVKTNRPLIDSIEHRFSLPLIFSIEHGFSFANGKTLVLHKTHGKTYTETLRKMQSFLLFISHDCVRYENTWHFLVK